MLIKERLNIHSFNDRFTFDNVEDFIINVNKRIYPLALFGYPIGFFHILRQMIGKENLYYWYYDKPNLLKEMLF